MVDIHQAGSVPGGVAVRILANEPKTVPQLRPIMSSWFTHELIAHATRGVSAVPRLRLIGTATDKAEILPFSFKGFTTEEVGRELSDAGIAVRAGHYCAQPILPRFSMETTVRPSMVMYNTFADVDALVATLYRMRGGRNIFNSLGALSKTNLF